MALTYRKIYTLIWDDEKFISLPALSKLVALYMLTSKQTNRIGLYRLSGALAIEDTGLNNFPKLFLEVKDRMCWGWDVSRKLVYIPSWWEWNKPENGNVLAGNLTDLEGIPYSPLVEEFLNNETFIPHALIERFRNVSETFRQRLAIQKQKQKQEQEQKQYPSPSNDAKLRKLPPQECFDLAKLLSEKILENDPGAKVSEASIENWAADADRMIRLDQRTVEQIRYLINWSQADSFWKANILSMGKLREKFGQLAMKAKAEHERKETPGQRTARNLEQVFGSQELA